MASALGNAGQADYATANSFLDNYAEYREKLRFNAKRHGKTLTINWPLWENAGMTVDERVKKYIRQNTGLASIPAEIALDNFGKIISLNSSRVIVAYGEPMIPLNLKWQTFAGVDIAEDDELLKLMKESGCLGAFLGFDAVNMEDLDLIGKKINKKFDYIKIVKKLQEEFGIPVIAGLIPGFDHDTVKTLDVMRNFLAESKAANLNFNDHLI